MSIGLAALVLVGAAVLAGIAVISLTMAPLLMAGAAVLVLVGGAMAERTGRGRR